MASSRRSARRALLCLWPVALALALLSLSVRAAPSSAARPLVRRSPLDATASLLESPSESRTRSATLVGPTPGKGGRVEKKQFRRGGLKGQQQKGQPATRQQVDPSVPGPSSSPLPSGHPHAPFLALFATKKLTPFPPSEPVQVPEECKAAWIKQALEGPTMQAQRHGASLLGADESLLLEAKAEAETAATVYPNINPGSVPNLREARKQARTLKEYDPDNPAVQSGATRCGEFPGYTVSRASPDAALGTPVCYYLDQHSRVAWAVVDDVKLGDDTDPKTGPKQYTTVLFDPYQALGKWAQFGRAARIWTPANYDITYSSVFEAGHIVAASLGGSNYEPLNFFSQTSTSNRGAGSNWNRAERQARDVKRGLDTLCAPAVNGVASAAAAPCSPKVQLMVGLEYQGVAHMPYDPHWRPPPVNPTQPRPLNYHSPSGGTYGIYIQGSAMVRMHAPNVAVPAELEWFKANAACVNDVNGVPTSCSAVINWTNNLN